jgi:acyl-ACP thioesterase
VDEEQKLTLASLINYFQDCSTFQSEECGCGLASLKEKRMAWMILSWQVEILRRPGLGEKIQSRTWPYAFKAFYGYRNYSLLDEQGAYLARANSVWALIDLDTGHPARVTPDVVSGYELEPRQEMADFSRKIHMPGDNTALESFPVTRNQLDTNHHVNNGQYIQMAEGFLPDYFETSVLRVEYRTQAHLHDIIVPMIHEEDGTYTVSLCDTDGKPYALVAFTETAEGRMRQMRTDKQ